MSYAILAACLWALVASSALGFRPQGLGLVRIYALIGCGVPILGWLVLSHGPLVGILALAVGAALLRWPLAGIILGLRSSFVRRLGASE